MSIEDRTLLHLKYYNIFGHRCLSLSTGSAHTPSHVYQFMKEILTRPPENTTTMPRLIYEGYGTMECGGISNNGKFLESVSWKLNTENGIVDLFNGGTLVGELFVQTRRMIGEYYNNVELTHDLYTSDGYFKTGDLVRLTCHCGSSEPENCCCEKLGGPHVAVIGRTTAAIKLSTGEYFSPEVIEGFLMRCASIVDLFMYLDPAYGYPIALVVAIPECLDVDMKTVQEDISNEIALMGLQEQLPNSYLPQGIVIIFSPFSTEDNLMTTSGKKCRKKIIHKYEFELLNCYEGIEKRKRLQILIGMFEAHLQGSTPLDPSSNIWQRGLDSLALVSVVNQITSVPALSKIPPDICKQYLLISENLDMFMNLIDQYLDMNLSPPCPKPNQWKECAWNDLHWKFLPRDTLPLGKSNQNAEKHILLLGFTGFIGSSIFASVISFDMMPNTVTLLVRSKHGIDIYTRFISIMLSLQNPNWNSENEILRLFSTVHIISSFPRVLHGFSQHQHGPVLYLIEGDLSETNFGLHSDVFQSLTSRITHCIYAAGQTSFISSYLQMRPSNILAIHNFLLMVSQCVNMISLIYLSSLSASFHPSLPSFRSYELNLSEYHEAIETFIHNCSDERSVMIGYPLSKMISEYLVSSYCRRFHIPYVSVQLGTISSNTETGYSNMTDFTTRLIHTLLLHSSMPPVVDNSFHGSIDLLPVNFIAEVVNRIYTNDLYTNQVLPIYTSRPTYFSDIISATLLSLSSTMSSPIPPSTSSTLRYENSLPLDEWIQQLSPSDPLFPLTSVISDILLSSNNSLSASAMQLDSTLPVSIDFAGMLIQIPAHLVMIDVNALIPKIVEWIRKNQGVMV